MIKRIGVQSMLLHLGLVVGLAGGAFAKIATPAKPKILYPEDLGPSQIDVSEYPAEYQETYRKIFLPVFGFLGGTARAVNSPVIELDPRLEAAERKNNPELFAEPVLADVSSDGWKKRVEQIHRRPPCCGACPVLSMKEARALWRFMAYDSIVRKTGPHAKSWLGLRRELVERFQREHPQKPSGLDSAAAYLAKERIR